MLYHLLQAFCEPGDEVVYAWRSFEAYPIAVAVTGAVSVQVPLTADARHDLDAMAAAVTDRTKVVIVCSPNNPTGPSVRRAELEAFLDRVPAHVVVVLDEAYREFVRDRGPLRRVEVCRGRAQRGGAAHLRQGLRPGRPPGRVRRRGPAVAAAVRACALPFGVSSVAQAAAVASLDREAELLERVDGLVAERARVAAALREPGLGRPGRAGQLRLAPARRADRGLRRRRATRPGSACGRSPATASASRIGEPAGNDVLLDVAAAFRR